MTEQLTRPARRSIGAQRNPASQQAILEAAQAVLMENGLTGFSIEAVARRAHAGKPTIYRWWPTKAALLLDVYHQRKHANFTYPDTGTARGDLTAYLSYLLATWRNPATGMLFRSVVAEAQANAETSAALAAYMAERRCQSGEIVRRGQARGEIAAGVNPEQVAELLSNYALVRLLTDRLDVGETEITAIIDMFLGGIAA